MTILRPEHLFEQAEKLISSPSGPLRQVNIRRAISNAYYGVFHCVLAAAADEFVGVTKRSTSQYGLVYRSIDHRSLRDLCVEVRKQRMSARFARYEPKNGFGPDLKAAAEIVLDLQEKRHAADYDPLIRVRTSDALFAIRSARDAVMRFGHANPSVRKAFLTLLAFPPR